LRQYFTNTFLNREQKKLLKYLCIILIGEGFLLVFSLADRNSFEEIYKFHKQVLLLLQQVPLSSALLQYFTPLYHKKP
jgi:hypothetical protein